MDSLGFWGRVWPRVRARTWVVSHPRQRNTRKLNCAKYCRAQPCFLPPCAPSPLSAQRSATAQRVRASTRLYTNSYVCVCARAHTLARPSDDDDATTMATLRFRHPSTPLIHLTTTTGPLTHPTTTTRVKRERKRARPLALPSLSSLLLHPHPRACPLANAPSPLSSPTSSPRPHPGACPFAHTPCRRPQMKMVKRQHGHVPVPVPLVLALALPSHSPSNGDRGTTLQRTDCVRCDAVPLVLVFSSVLRQG